jgi:hypothetical protein
MTIARLACLTTFAVVLLGSAAGSQPAEPLAGTWTLNVAQSKFAGPPPKGQTTRLEPVDGGLREIVERVNADGSTTKWDVTVKYDGRDYPVTGDPARDTVSFRRANDGAVEVVNKKGGAVVSRMRIVVAPDGRTRTNTVVATDASGRTTESVMFFDRR